MFVGVIRNRDIFFNPLAVISIKGFRGFFKVLGRALSFKKYKFINLLEQTQKIFIGNLKKK